LTQRQVDDGIVFDQFQPSVVQEITEDKMSTEDDRRSRRRILFWGILVLVILLSVCIWLHAKQVPDDIARRASNALTAAGFDSRFLQTVDGRVAILSGEIEAETNREQLVETARSVRGVRRVIDKLTVIKLDPARLSLQLSSAGVMLSGVMPNQSAVDKVFESTAAIYGKNNVTNQIRVQKRVREPVWLDGVLAILPELKPADSMGIEASQSGVVLNGVVDSPETRTRIAEQAETLLAGKVPIDNRLQVMVPQRPAHLRYRIKGAELEVSGELPSQEAVARVMSAAMDHFAPDKITSTLTVGDRVSDPSWLEAVLALTAEMAAADQGAIEASDKGVTLSGVVASTDTRTAIENRAKALLGNQRLNNQIIVKPPPEVKPEPAAVVELPTLRFKHASTELTEDSKPLLDEIAGTLQGRPDLRIEVAAHTDSSGEEVLNVDLSERRTQAIVQYLVSRGINPNSLVQRSYGESQPVAENTTKEGRALNRRIEFKVIE
jgi:OOP family OmpA-OmpF porin